MIPIVSFKKALNYIVVYGRANVILNFGHSYGFCIFLVHTWGHVYIFRPGQEKTMDKPWEKV